MSILSESGTKNNQVANGSAESKKIRCKYAPNCNRDGCPYFHPTETCTYFPACNRGNKCLFLHPEVDCKFGLNCTRQNCVYKHPKGFNPKFASQNSMNLNMMQMMMAMQNPGAFYLKPGGFKPKPTGAPTTV